MTGLPVGVNASDNGLHPYFPATLMIYERSRDLELDSDIESFWAGGGDTGGQGSGGAADNQSAAHLSQFEGAAGGGFAAAAIALCH